MSNKDENVYDDLLDKEQVAEFYQNFPGLLKQVFLRPIDGLRELFAGSGGKSFFQGILLIATTVVLTLLVALVLGGAGMAAALKASVVVALILLAISGATFGVKAVMGQNADFSNEILVGGICGIGYSVALLLIAFLSLLDNTLMLRLMMAGPGGGGLVVTLIVIYVFIFLINAITQSLKAGKVPDVAAFYLAPTIFVVANYLVIKLAAAIF